MTDFKIIQRHPRLVVKYKGFQIERFLGGHGFKDYPSYLALAPTPQIGVFAPIGVSYRYRREAAAFIDDYINGHALQDGSRVKDPGRSTATERS